MVTEHRRNNVFDGVGVAHRGPVPDASSESHHVDHFRMKWVRHNAMAPLEIVSPNALPRSTAIVGPPRGRFKSAGIHSSRIARVNGNVVNVLVAIEGILPSFAAIGGNENSAAYGGTRRVTAPRR